MDLDPFSPTTSEARYKTLAKLLAQGGVHRLRQARYEID